MEVLTCSDNRDQDQETSYPDGCVKLRNSNIELMDQDILYHLALGSGSHDLVAMFGDVKFVCMGGTPKRMEQFSNYIMDEIEYKLPTGSCLQDICYHSYRYSMYKIGPVLSVSHGMGCASIGILLHELIKLMYHAKIRDPIFIRIGTCGGIGLEGGTVVVSNDAVDCMLNSHYELSVLGKKVYRVTKLDKHLANDIFSLSNPDDPYDTVRGRTMATHDFYEEQGRLDGAFCNYTEQEKCEYLQRLHKEGVVNIEMEATAFAALTHYAGIKAAIVCVTFLDRLKGDQVMSPKEVLQEWQMRPQILVSRFIKQSLSKMSAHKTNISVEIHVKKLFDWLINRRICARNWRENLSIIYKKVQSAIQEIPEHDEIKDTLLNNMDYDQCQKVVDILKLTEGKSKNIFGRYSSQKMNDWLEIVYLYEKNNNYLAELCNKCYQLVQFELPIIKQKLMKSAQNVNELNKKKKKISQELSLAKADISHFLCEYSIKEQDDLNFRKQLIESTKVLRVFNNETVSKIRLLEPYFNFYIQFVQNNHKVRISLQHIHILIEKGNITQYEWQNGGLKPDFFIISKVAHFKDDNVDEKNDNNKDSFIDFGDMGDVESVNTVDEQVPKIKEEETYYLLDDRQFTYELISEMKELEAFWQMRAIEDKEVSNALSVIHNCYNTIFDKKMQNVRRLTTSSKYFDNVIAQFNKKILLRTKLQKSITDTDAKIYESLELTKHLTQKKNVIIEKALIFKKKIEKEISQKHVNQQSVRLICDLN